MFLDALLEFDSYAGVAVTVTRDSTNILDMGADRDMAVGQNVLDIFCGIIQTFTTGDAAVLTAEVKGAADNGSGAPSTFYSLAQSPTALAAANLVAGREILRMPLPYWSAAVSNDDGVVPRFYKLTYTVTVGSFTAGKLAAYLVPHFGRDATRPYPKAYANTYI